MSDLAHLHENAINAITERSLGPKNGIEYIRAIPRHLETVAPAFVDAMARAGLPPHGQRAVLEALFEANAQDRPAHHHRHTARGRQAVLEEKLARGLRRGLPLKLAAAEAGVSLERVKGWTRADPGFRDRLEEYRRCGVAQVHGFLLDRAAKGSETAIVKALEYSGEPEYTPKLRVGRITEDDVVQSEAFQRFLRVQLPALLCPECRDRVKEAGGG